MNDLEWLVGTQQPPGDLRCVPTVALAWLWAYMKTLLFLLVFEFCFVLPDGGLPDGG